MSKLRQLIQELCPDGVEYKLFSEVCQYIRGITYNKSKEAKTGDLNAHKVLRANNITLLTNTLNFDDVKLVDSSVRVKKEQYLYHGDILICAGSGSKEHIGKVAYIFEDLDYTFGGFMAVIRCDKILISRFLFHVLTSEIFKKYLDTALNSSTINNLNMGVMKDFQIPIPPIEIQQEIVRILDNFTELTTVLTTELTARRQQFEYYRCKLYEFKSDVKWVKTTDLTKDSFWLMPATPNYIDSGVPYITSKNIKNNSIDFENVKYISFTDYISISANRAIKEGDMLITMIGTIGEAAFVGNFTDFYGQNMYLLRLDETKVNKNFFYYYFTSPRIRNSLISKKNTSSQGYIKAGSIENLKVPLPSMDLQNRIVDILDNFNSLCNDLFSGLPAEIEARLKQYEYYQNKLLKFKELSR